MCAFSHNGRLAATCSADRSIKVRAASGGACSRSRLRTQLLDVAVMRSYAAMDESEARPKPTLRSYYDHVDVRRRRRRYDGRGCLCWPVLC